MFTFNILIIPAQPKILPDIWPVMGASTLPINVGSPPNSLIWVAIFLTCCSSISAILSNAFLYKYLQPVCFELGINQLDLLLNYKTSSIF